MHERSSLTRIIALTNWTKQLNDSAKKWLNWRKPPFNTRPPPQPSDLPAHRTQSDTSDKQAPTPTKSPTSAVQPSNQSDTHASPLQETSTPNQPSTSTTVEQFMKDHSDDKMLSSSLELFESQTPQKKRNWINKQVTHNHAGNANTAKQQRSRFFDPEEFILDLKHLKHILKTSLYHDFYKCFPFKNCSQCKDLHGCT